MRKHREVVVPHFVVRENQHPPAGVHRGVEPVPVVVVLRRAGLYNLGLSPSGAQGQVSVFRRGLIAELFFPLTTTDIFLLHDSLKLRWSVGTVWWEAISYKRPPEGFRVEHGARRWEIYYIFYIFLF